MKLKFTHIILIILTGFLFSCREFPEDNLNLRLNCSEPSLEIVDVKNISAQSVTFSGKILLTNGAEIDKIGVNWGTTEESIHEYSISQNFVSKEFEITVENLKPQIKYHFVLFAHNAVGNGYSDPIIVTTKTGLGSVQTGFTDKISSTSAICKGNILDSGESEVKEVGFFFSNDAKFNHYDSITGKLNQKDFEATIKDLTPNTVYHYKAFAKNSFGTFVGTIKSFRTAPKKEYTNIKEPIIVELGTARINFVVLERTKEMVKRVGICWGLKSNPTIENFSLDSEDYTPGHYSLLIKDLFSNSKYFVRGFIEFEDGIIEYSKQKEFTTPPNITELESFKGLPRILSANFVIENRGYIICGDLGNFFSNELWEYNTEVGGWREWRSFPGGVRRSPIAIANDNLAYTLGGETMSNGAMNDFYSYDPEVNTWKQLASIGDKKFSISNAAAIIHNNFIFIAGGYQNKQLSDEIWRYSITDDEWVKLPTKLPIASKQGLFYIKGDSVFYGFATIANNKTSNLWSIDIDFKESWNLEYTNPNTKIRNSVFHKSLNSIFFINSNGILYQLKLDNHQLIKRITLPKEDSGDDTLMVINKMIYFGASRYSDKFYCFDPWWKDPK